MAVTLKREQRDAARYLIRLKFGDEGEVGEFVQEGNFSRARQAAREQLALVDLLERLVEGDSAGEVDISFEGVECAARALLEFMEDHLAFVSRWLRGQAPDFLGEFGDPQDIEALNENLDTRIAATTILEAAAEEGR